MPSHDRAETQVRDLARLMLDMRRFIMARIEGLEYDYAVLGDVEEYTKLVDAHKLLERVDAWLKEHHYAIPEGQQQAHSRRAQRT